MLQGSVTDAGPVHVPPFASSTVFCLFLVRFPPPHVTLQVPVVHDPHSQLTLRDKIKRLLNLTISIAMKSKTPSVDILKRIYQDMHESYSLQIRLKLPHNRFRQLKEQDSSMIVFLLGFHLRMMLYK